MRLFAFLFLLTGIFAITGSLFCWGKGWLFAQTDLQTVLIPMADLFLTGPLSLLTAYQLFIKKNSGVLLGLITSGTYLLGSVLAFIMIFWNGFPYPIELVIPSASGFCIALAFCWRTLKKYKELS